MVDFQTDYLLDLEGLLGVDTKTDRRTIFYKWWKMYRADPMAYRETTYRSKVTGHESVLPKAKFMDCLTNDLFQIKE